MPEKDRPYTTARGTCVSAKQARLPFMGELIQHSKELTVHFDICGRLRMPAHSAKQYFLTMTITPHRYICTKPIESKSNEHEICMNDIEWLERNKKASVEKEHSDNAK